jgi:multiple sugar transport system ATP-binding protein
MALISIQNIWKSFDNGEPVLRDCSLEIGEHEFLVLVGPSGSGKTTLLRIISGLEDATEGDLYFDDKRVNDVDVGDRDIAMVFQNYGLYPHMTVANNMAFGLRRRKIPRHDIDSKVQATAETLGISHLLDRRPRALSGGQRQRVALGRAIVRDPAVFLLDEPLSNLDAHLRTQMRSEILNVHRTVTATAVYVTHDQVEALTMGDRIAVMHDGVIQQVETPERLYDRPVNKFVAGFIGTPPMGFLGGRLERPGGGDTWVTSPSMRIKVPFPIDDAEASGGDEVVVGVRPEGLRLASESVSGDADESWLRGIVDIVEPLGSELHVLFTAERGETLTARLPRGERPEHGQNVTFRVDSSVIHLFASDSGRALRREEG